MPTGEAFDNMISVSDMEIKNDKALFSRPQYGLYNLPDNTKNKPTIANISFQDAQEIFYAEMLPSRS